LERKIKIDWRAISACTYCSNHNAKESYCSEHKKELNIYEELRGCEKIAFTGSLSLELFEEIPKDSILRELSINDIASLNPKVRRYMSSKDYGDYFTKTTTLKQDINLAKSEKEGETIVISFERFQAAVKEFENAKAMERYIHLSDHLPLGTSENSE
jgi:hypothetical protein